ncbi:PilZ domain-containing protein [bacterium]|nr:PilZ domain-containing protein [bacterium]
MTALKKVATNTKPIVLLFLKHEDTEKLKVSELLAEIGAEAHYIQDATEGKALAQMPETFLAVVDTSSSEHNKLFRELRIHFNTKVKWVFVISPNLSPSKVSSFYNFGAMNVINRPLHPLVLQMQARQAIRSFTNQKAKPLLTVIECYEEAPKKPSNLTLDHFLSTPDRKNLLRAKNLFITEKPQKFELVSSKKIVRNYYDIGNTFQTPIVVWSANQEEVLFTHIKSLVRWQNKAILHNPDNAFLRNEHETLFTNLRLGPVSTFSKVKLVRGEHENFELRIEIPESAHKLQRRQQLRTILKDEVQVEASVDGETHKMVMLDVSTGGCRVYKPSFAWAMESKVGQSVDIYFNLKSFEFSLSAEISWVDSEKAMVGLDFKNLSLTDHSQIEAYVYTDSQDLFETGLRKLV